MNINEQELSEAVDRLREGEPVFGLCYEEILLAITRKHGVIFTLLKKLGDNESVQVMFEEKFNEIARYELREALRTHKEQQAGLM